MAWCQDVGDIAPNWLNKYLMLCPSCSLL